MCRQTVLNELFKQTEKQCIYKLMAHNSKITSNMELITNSRGQTKLCYEDHSYVKKNASKSTIRWQCSRRCAESCKGALVTDLGVSSLDVIRCYMFIFHAYKFRISFTHWWSIMIYNKNAVYFMHINSEFHLRIDSLRFVFMFYAVCLTPLLS